MALNTIAGELFHGWNISSYANNPGLRDNLPAPKEDNLLRIFGNMPSGVTVEDLIYKANLDIDNFPSIDVIIYHPGVKITLFATNTEGEKRFDIKLGDHADLIIEASREKLQRVMHV